MKKEKALNLETFKKCIKQSLDSEIGCSWTLIGAIEYYVGADKECDDLLNLLIEKEAKDRNKY